MEANHVNHWPTPPESPDLNPIENLWAAVKHHIKKEVKPRTKEELINGIKEFWATLTPEKCGRYIHHLYKVVPAVIAREGAASGY
jgi:transposase